MTPNDSLLNLLTLALVAGRVYFSYWVGWKFTARKGRTGGGWKLAAVVSPLITLIVLACLQPLALSLGRPGVVPNDGVLPWNGRCPDCGGDRFLEGPHGELTGHFQCANTTCKIRLNILLGGKFYERIGHRVS
jgi:hypothetical protein